MDAPPNPLLPVCNDDDEDAAGARETAELYGPSYGTMSSSSSSTDASSEHMLEVVKGSQRRRRRRIEAMVSILTAALSLGVFWASRRVHSASGHVKLHTTKDSGSWQVDCKQGEACLYASNEYERLLGRPIANGRFVDGIVLEMYQETRLEVEADACELEVSGDVEVRHSAGCLMDLRARALGVYGLTARIIAKGEKEARVVTFAMTAKYVRRDIRDMTDDDRDRFFRAVAVTLRVDDDAGARLYGDDYRSTDYFVRLHLDGLTKGREACRKSPAFLNNLVAIATQFERSLQSIDPKIALPYWDMTSSFAHSDVEDLVGPSNNSQRVVDSGRFAFTPLRTNARSYSNVTNAYGLLASPWDTNPTPFVTRSDERYGAGPTIGYDPCDAFRRVSYRSLTTLTDDLSHVLRAFVEEKVGGGSWNYLPSLREQQAKLDELVPRRQGDYTSLTKSYWRMGFVTCPEFCAHDTPSTECTCALSEMAQNRFESAYDLFNATRHVSFDLFGTRLDDPSVNSTLWEMALNQISNGGHFATISDGAAPNDPLFWLLPGSLERYVQQIRYVASTGQFYFDTSWNPAKSWENDASIVRQGKSEDDCEGSREQDVLPFKVDDLLADVDAPTITSGEYFNSTAPFSPNLRYVYDQLLNWTDCALDVF